VFRGERRHAAAIAELFHGHGRNLDDFLFVFIGPAIGGGIVLGRKLLRGATRNAGDLGVIPVAAFLPRLRPAPGGQRYFARRASLKTHWRGICAFAASHRSLEDLPAGGDGEKAVLEWLDDCGRRPDPAAAGRSGRCSTCPPPSSTATCPRPGSNA